jgi:hypothetical protein
MATSASRVAMIVNRQRQTAARRMQKQTVLPRRSPERGHCPAGKATAHHGSHPREN